MNPVEKIDSKFRLAIMVARRSKQLINGAKPLVDIKAENPLTIAIEEINQGLITKELLNDVNIYLPEIGQVDEIEENPEDNENDMELTINETEVEPDPAELNEPDMSESEKPDSPEPEKE